MALALVVLAAFAVSALRGKNLISATAKNGAQPESARAESLTALATPAPVSNSSDSGKDVSRRVNQAYGKLPLGFEANEGQADSQVKFISRGSGYELFLTSNQAVLALKKNTAQGSRNKTEKRDRREPVKFEKHEEAALLQTAVLRMSLDGANPSPQIEGVDGLPGKVNYMIGNDREKWRTNVQTYAKVRYQEVYKGVDLIYYGNQRQLEYDFIVAPDADPQAIKLDFQGTQKLALNRQGDLSLKTGGGEVLLHRPVAYQEIDGARREIASRYVLKNQHQVGFEVSEYDRSKPLVIDPVMVYSTYLNGGSSDGHTDLGNAIAVDSSGNAYVTGQTYSPAFPITPGAFQNTLNGIYYVEAFVTKLNPSGTALVYSTYLGGSSIEAAYGIAVDSAGQANVVGITCSNNFPVLNAYQSAKGDSAINGNRCDAFVTKLNATGSALVYSTYLGGTTDDTAYGIALDLQDNAYVTGNTFSTNFPTLNAMQSAKSGHPLFKSTNGGSSWNSGNGLDAAIVYSLAAAPTSPNTIYAGTEIGIYKSTDGGSNWTTSNNGLITPFGYTVTALAVDPANPNTVYAGTQSNVYKSTDGGGSWTNTGFIQGGVRALAISPTNPATIYAGTSLGFYKSTNGGSAWVKKFFSNSVSVISIAVDPNNPNNIYLGTVPYGAFKSTDGGETGGPSNNGLLSGQGTAMIVDPANPSTIYAGTETGAHKSTDGGANWTTINNGLSATYGETVFTPWVKSLSLDPTTPNTIYAGTNYGGVFKSTDGGANWTPVNTGVTNSIINALLVNYATPATVLAGASGGKDAFVAKFSPTGTPAYSTYFGGSEDDEGDSIATDASGNVYLTGFTYSKNLPTANPLQSGIKDTSDAFILKLNAAGSAPIYSTYLGGKNSDTGASIAADASGNAYVTGYTYSEDFPTTAGAFDTKCGDDGKCNADEFGAYSDVYVTKLAANGSALTYSTFVGGTSWDYAYGLAVDSNGNAYVTGSTYSGDFPVVDPIQPTPGQSLDAFIFKLNAAGTALGYSSYLGGFDDDHAKGIAVDAAGSAYVVGVTRSLDFPTVNPLQTSDGGDDDAFVLKLSSQPTSLTDLSITKTPQKTTVSLNENVIYTIVVTNGGPTNATGVAVTDTLPSGLAFVSASSTQGSCAGTSTVTCQLGNLAANASATVTITAKATGRFQVNNTASVSGNESDPNTNNNSATTGVYIIPQLIISGHVRDVSGNGISGVTITLSGSQSATTQTDATGSYQFTGLAAGGNYVVTPSKPTYNFTPASRSFFSLSDDATADFSQLLNSLQFMQAGYSATESAGSATIVVVRSGGDVSGTISVDYATSDGTATQRRDYTSATGTLTFGPNELNKSFSVLITDDAYVDGNRTVNLTLSNPVGATLATPGNAVLTITDNDTTAPTTNPIDDARFFVRQHYYDFLNREPDPDGLAYWSDQIAQCGTDQNCINSRRIGVSAAYFIELEFQDTGSFVYRFYKASYGQRPTYAQFIPDRSRVVGGANLEVGKQAFAEQWVQRPEFLQKYPANLTGVQFVDALLQTVQQGSGVDLSSKRDALIADYNANQSRARIVRLITDDATFQAAEYNRAFVLMQYFGYLRRDPDEGGYLFWLDVLNNRVANNYRGMVCAFINSAEYQDRFSSVITRNDQICASLTP